MARIAVDEASVIRAAFGCGVEDWLDFMGDPLLSGTIFVISYAGTAWLILSAARRLAGRERWYWRLCGSVFLFQVANTHLDLHGLVWTTGRCLAQAQGWYENRREVQLIFLVAVSVLLGLVLLTALIVFFREILVNSLLTLGVLLAFGFTIVKGINLHGLESHYGGRVGPFRVADFIEWSGIVLAFVAAVLVRARRGHPRSGRMT